MKKDGEVIFEIIRGAQRKAFNFEFEWWVYYESRCEEQKFRVYIKSPLFS